MKCQVIAVDECNEFVVSDKVCTFCILKKIYRAMREKNDIQSDK